MSSILNNITAVFAAANCFQTQTATSPVIKSSTSSSTSSFPSQEIMRKYLNNHPLLAYDYYLREKRIVEKTIQAFANTPKTPEEVQAEILLILKPIGLGEPFPILRQIEKAVQDCAAGKFYASNEHKAK